MPTPRLDRLHSVAEVSRRTADRRRTRAREREASPSSEAPMRAELFSVSQLERHARRMASWHAIDTTRRAGADGLLARLSENEAVLRAAYRLVAEAVAAGRQITPAAEWFIDNFHLIEEQIRTARRHLPRGYHRELPRLANASMRGAPRVYDLALELISHSHGRVDAEALRAFVAAYQSVQPLRLGELWAIPIMLRLALLENLRRVAVAVAAGRRDRERAAAWVAEMVSVASSDPAAVVLVLADMVEEDPPLSDPFVAELASSLQEQGPPLAFAMAWLEHRLGERGRTVEHVFEAAIQSQAADQVSVGNSIGSIRFLGATDWRDFVEAMSVVERTLRTDPAGTYPSMDFGTRDRYRHVVESIARRSARSEEEVALEAIELATRARDADPDAREAHVGHFLIDDGLALLERSVRARVPLALAARRLADRSRLAVYFGAIAGLTGLGAWALASVMPIRPHGWTIAPWLVLLALCASQLAVALVHWAATMVARPELLPRIDLSRGIPPEHRTLVAVPTMLTDRAEIDEQLEALEVRFLANRDPNLAFGLVTDLRDAPTETTDRDDELVARAREGIEALAAEHGGAFFLFHRARRWNPRQGAWMGWERKRGKLEDLNEALRGDEHGFAVIVGDRSRLTDTRYVIALDADTALPRDAARRLVGTMAHPLNRPVIDEARGRVIRGHGILQPRVMASMASTAASRFARLFGGEPGIDPYTRAVSDVYQDVFGEGSFIGKGIYDVDAVRRTLGGRLPDDRVLSHDLLEGGYARSALVSDVLLVEDHPSSHAADVSRRARWMRGDWQIAAWLLPWAPGPGGRRAHNPISLLSRWKILDNLRRSLVPAGLIALLLVGWAVGAAVPATLAVATILALPGLVAAAVAMTRRPEALPHGLHLRDVAQTAARQLARDVFAVACLPHEAWIGLLSAGQATVRVMVTHRRLLEWRTARDAQRTARTDLRGSYASMAVAPAVASGTAAALASFAPATLVAAAPVLALWAAAPALAWWSSRPLVAPAPRLDAADLLFLHGVARRTWRFFETFVGEDDHHLPPDNVQEDPPRGAAHRTSPTNIGLSLLANLAAHDFGYLTTSGVARRTALGLASLDRLERHRGHFYNWYDTSTLEPLRPTYVSTVDSGNLSGHLLILAVGLEELARRPVLPTRVLDGLRATIELLVEEAGPSSEAAADAPQLLALTRDEPRSRTALLTRLRTLDELALELVDRTAPGPAGPSWAIDALHAQVAEAILDLASFAPWLDQGGGDDPRLDGPLTLAEVAALGDTVAPELAVGPLRDAVERGAARARARIDELAVLAGRCRALADAEVEFLYDRERNLLSIGYSVVEHRLDASFYDLLASEARLASYVALAQGKLPQEHWFSLDRSLTTTGGQPALLSWSGSMFEYLMPLLVMPTYDRTLLDQTYRAVVDRQIEYGRERGVPWGVSESGYAKTDAQLNYQYRAFGVPGLGFKRGLVDDLVVTPYASAMALMVAPEAACANLRRLAREERRGDYGFYEAIDYTPARLPPGAESVTVRSYMAHHQGMTFLSLAYLLLDRPMQRRFAAEPSFRAIELLLQERVPRVPAIHPHPAELSAAPAATAEAEHELRSFSTAATEAPEVHLLSNGTYHVAITNAGGGYSRWRDLAVTRWQEDTTRDCWGTFLYLRDVATGAFWSGAHQPTLAPAKRYEAIHAPGRAEFRREDGAIETHVEIAVSPEDDVELRRVTLVNNDDDAPRTIELTSFAEVVLTQPAADAAHRAFSSLFVQTELLRGAQAILCTRRPRSAAERPPWMVHLLTVDGTAVGEASYETSRAAFIGRGRTAADPVAMHVGELAGGAGSVLDPVVAIRHRVLLKPGETARIHVVTGVAETREGALALIEKYGDRHAAGRVLELSWTHCQVLQRRLRASHLDVQLYERLASHVLYGRPNLRAPRSLIARSRGGQSRLWAYGISGDLPIALVRVGDVAHIQLVRQLVEAHAFWRLKGLAADLVVWNEDASGYRQVLHDEILAVIGATADAGSLDKPGGIFVRRSEQIAEEDKVLLQTVARVIVTGTAGSLAEQMDRRPLADHLPPPLIATSGVALEATPPPPVPPGPAPRLERPDLVLWNGLGGFTRDGREYVVATTCDARTPAPWVNVIANPWFGTVVSESGGAYTWCENAHGYRLTPWNNDAVSDPSGEGFYLRDEETGHVWCPTPGPIPTARPTTCRHGFGYSAFEANEGGVTTELMTFVATDAPVKLLVLKIRNGSGKARRLSALALFELVLGTHRAGQRLHVVTEVDVATSALFARNPYSSEHPSRVAFLDCSEKDRSVSGDRGEVLGRNGTPVRPACLSRTRLSGRVGAGLDPCFAMQATIDLADGQEREIAFTFGSGRDVADARQLVGRFRGVGAAHTALDAVWAHWNRTLGAVSVQTPDASVNFLANGWLVYQVLACRMWARSGFYQSGGAFGFRDQLQDAMALVHAAPVVLREQIVRAAGRQFPEGDVQHWWHPPEGRGVRTRISDDYLWLPYAVCRYVAAIGDTGVLDEKVGFLEGRAVRADEDSYYDLPARSDESATVYEHCVRAIRNGLRRGEHGLPLMGTGDWNDGMNLVGEGGRGESVWLAFFLHDVLLRFAELATRRGDLAFAGTCGAEAALLRESIEAHGWDGGWYRRAYFDDGTPLGSATNEECSIDSLPQSWAMLTHLGDPERARRGLEAVEERLVRRDLGVIQLFDPPFDRSALDPGYVKGYVPGVRENGGQYTHAAVWTVMAFAAAGEVEKAWELFRLIDPVRHGDTAAKIATYRVEPYVVAADVYVNPEHAGRGGWTWYTGSAGWMLRLLLESLLGIRLEIDRLRIEPLLPAAWPGFAVHYRYRETVFHVTVERAGEGQAVRLVEHDGAACEGGIVRLVDDRRDHHVRVVVGG